MYCKGLIIIVNNIERVLRALYINKDSTYTLATECEHYFENLIIALVVFLLNCSNLL